MLLNISSWVHICPHQISKNGKKSVKCPLTYKCTTKQLTVMVEPSKFKITTLIWWQGELRPFKTHIRAKRQFQHTRRFYRLHFHFQSWNNMQSWDLREESTRRQGKFWWNIMSIRKTLIQLIWYAKHFWKRIS